MPSVALQPQDLLVEYRDKTLKRQGAIPFDDLLLKMQPVYCGVGSWTVQLPVEHRAVPYLRAPGAGIVVTNLRTGEALLSGSTSRPAKRATVSDPKGLISISGLTDDRLLWDARAFPSPSIADPAAQTAANDIRTAQASSLMRQYVNANIGPGSPVARRGTSLRNNIVLGPDPALGPVVSRRPRYDVLGDLLYGIAVEAGLGFRLVQVGNTLEFQVYQPSDRTRTIRLDIHNGTLNEQSVEVAVPEVTRMIIGGQGEGVNRQMISMTTPQSVQAEDDWGLIIEEFKDQRNTGVEGELESAGLERLNEAGFTKVALKATPSNDQTMIFLTDFFMGDRVSVVIDEQEQPNSIITEAAIVVDWDGIKTAVAIGDIADFDSDSALRQTVTDTQQRVSNLERNAEAIATTYGVHDFWTSGTQLRAMRGNTAERDAWFGTPPDAAGRASIANSRPVWFNTDNGFEEQYYAENTAPGLIVPGLLGGNFGWFPKDEGPFCTLVPSAGIQTAAGSYVGGWAGSAYRRGGPEWFTYTAQGIIINKPGRYDLSAWSIQQSGSGAAIYALHALTQGTSAVLKSREHSAAPLQAAPFLAPIDMRMEFYALVPFQLLLRTISGSLAIHQTAVANGERGQLSARYLGPVLALD